MNAAKWAYYARRLRTLRGNEPFYRLGSWARHAIEKRILRSDPLPMSWERLWSDRSDWLKTNRPTDDAECFNQALLEALPSHWWQDSNFWNVFSRLYPEGENRLISMAEKIFNGRFQLFRWKEVHRPKPIRWSETIESESSSDVWPDSYYSDIAVSHDPHRPDRDIKWCWELNRFQHLLWLGASWRLTGQDRFAALAREHLESWLNSVQYPFGVQWTSNLEVALRGLSFAWCHALCLNSPEWDIELLSRFIPCVHAHGVHLEKELTVHHTEGNHILGESSALYCLSSLYPLFSEAARWRERSIKILNRLVPRVIQSDGVYAEQSTGYFRFIAEFMLQVLLVDCGRGSQLSDIVRERLIRGLYFIQNVAADATEVPMIGDSDTGLALGWRLSDFWDFTPLLATGSVVLGEPQLARGIPRFPAESFLMLGEKGLQAFESQKSETIAGPDPASAGPIMVFPDGGYHISRDERFGVIFDAGPLGIAPAYGHGHADGLSFILHYEKRPVIVDPGTFVYNGPRVWRNYFRCTAAHNTVRIDGRDPVSPIETFRWSGPLKIEQAKPIRGEGWRILRGAVHWKRIVHRRYLIHVIDQGIIILDRIEGAGAHDLEWRLHFDPRWEVKTNAGGTFLCKKVPPTPFSRNSISRSSGSPNAAWCESLTAEFEVSRLDIGLVSRHPGEASVLQGSMDPMGGWYSRYYGSKVSAPTLTVKTKVQLPATMLAVVKPSDARLILPRDLPETLFARDLSDLLRLSCWHGGE